MYVVVHFFSRWGSATLYILRSRAIFERRLEHHLSVPFFHFPSSVCGSIKWDVVAANLYRRTTWNFCKQTQGFTAYVVANVYNIMVEWRFLSLNSKKRFETGEILEWYDGFLQDCPNGKLSQPIFSEMFKEFFPATKPEEFSKNVFRYSRNSRTYCYSMSLKGGKGRNYFCFSFHAGLLTKIRMDSLTSKSSWWQLISRAKGRLRKNSCGLSGESDFYIHYSNEIDI